MNPYAEEKIMAAHQKEIVTKIKRQRLVEQAKQSARENSEETAGRNLRQQLGSAIIRFGYKVAGRSQISLEVKG